MAAAAEENVVAVEGEVQKVEENDGSLLYVSNLPWSVEDDALAKMFGEHGKVVEASVVISNRSGRSRGYGFVKMASAEDAQAALKALHESVVEERDLRVEVAKQTKSQAHARAPRERRQRNNDNGRERKEQPANDGTLLYVSNLAFAVEDDELAKLFAEHGTVVEASIVRSSRDPSRSRGYGFVKFESVEDAKAALEAMNGTEHMERALRVEIARSTIPSEGAPRRRRRNRNRGRRDEDDQRGNGEGEE